MINDAFINTQELEIELNSIRQIADNLNIYFPLLSQKIAYIFTKIKECKTIQEANDYFELLDKIQAELAYLLYTHNIGMPGRLGRFVHDFDNLESVYREYYFNKIKSGEYLY